MRKRLLLLGATVVVLFLGVLIVLNRPGAAVTRANYDRLAEQMTEAEVVHLLGPPSDTSPHGKNWGELHNGKLTIGHQRIVWGGDDGGARIVFDEHGKLVYKLWVDAPRPFWTKVRAWVGL